MNLWTLVTKIVICCDQHLVKLRKKEEVVDSKEMQLLAKQKDQVGDKQQEMQVVVCVLVITLVLVVVLLK